MNSKTPDSGDSDWNKRWRQVAIGSVVVSVLTFATVNFVDSCSSLAALLAVLLIVALGVLTIALVGVAVTASDAGDRRGFGCGAAVVAFLFIVTLLGSVAAGAVIVMVGCW